MKLKEAPALGKTIYHHAPDSAGARDYTSLMTEVMQRLQLGEYANQAEVIKHRLSVVAGVGHE